jgi:hypothetical protein
MSVNETSLFTPTDPTYITPIECPHCGSSARLMRRTPVPGGEERTFECDACTRKTILTVKD